MGAIECCQITEDILFTPEQLPKPIILVGKNGTGKTTLISSIVDSLYELSNNSFDNILPKRGSGYQYFKISGAKNIRVNSEYAFSFIEFKNNDKFYQYIDKNLNISHEDCLIKTMNLLKLPKFEDNNENIKISTTTENDNNFTNDFTNNSYCYFPSDRYELPYWINKDTIQQFEKFKEHTNFAGRLNKEILVRTSLSEIKQWILDVFLDSRTNLIFNEDNSIHAQSPIQNIQLLQTGIHNIETILSKILQREISINLNLRSSGQSRIKIVDRETNQDYIPSLDNLSAGQSSLLSIFITIIMHSDQNDVNKSIKIQDIEGIVIIDEIDLHLHIELQHEVLPELIKIFPKVQFVISTHSPFFLAGMAKNFQSDEYLMLNMPNGNLLTNSDDFEEFSSVYNIFNNLTDTYKKELDQLKEKINVSNKPLIITEGKTDWKHLKAALKNQEDLTTLIEFLEFEDGIPMGCDALDKMLQHFKNIPNQRKIIGIFDRDEPSINKKYKEISFQELGNNVYAFCIPKINDDLDEISIEHYYLPNDLYKEDIKGRRLFSSTEFDERGISKCKTYTSDNKNRSKKLKIFDSGITKIQDSSNSCALSKNDFAENILHQKNGFETMNFTNFNLIFNIVREIISDQT